ncbi:MAG: hypothetical protein K2L73_02995, partial [Muribaculaceae bacterium]|nr:hypothetical protein [Muribaculaceae bacterium]
GETRELILNALGYNDASIDDVNELNRKFNRELGSLDSKVSVKFANSVWAKPYITFINSFTSSLSDNYNAEVRKINDDTFVNDINKWCSSKTNGKITGLLPDGSTAPSFALYNATYFKGIWSQEFKFDKRQTIDDYFNDVQGSRSVTKFMKKDVTGHVLSPIYGQTETLQKCELSFGNGSFGAAFILPAEGITIHQAIENLANGDWEKLNKPYPPILEICNDITIHLTLPKFKIESEINFNKYMHALDMGDVLADNADYSNMTEAKIPVNDVKQKATFEIDEEGAVAAAVTGSGLDWASDPEEYKYITMTFDRPFIYVVYEHSTGAILFAGCVNSFAN